MTWKADGSSWSRPPSQEALLLATPILISDADDPRLEPYRAVRERDLLGRQGLFLLEGEVVLRQALAAGRFALESVLMSSRRIAGSAALVALIPDRAPLYEADDALIERLTGFAVHRGILAAGRRGEAPGASKLIAALPAEALVVAAVGLANHDNMGGLFRNAAAFGVDALLLDDTCCDPLYRKSIRVSVGAALTVPFARGAAGVLLSELAASGFAVHGLSPAATNRLDSLRPGRRTALVLGAEGEGLPASLMAGLDLVRIAMHPGLDSLNVATASGIALHHIFVQRRRAEPS
jgi:tRNA G18 (ribose-2'-O)-methylase SpoU